MEDIEATAWRNSSDQDLWVFDKLIVGRKLGYNCGPAGMDVPQPGLYITRPCVNIPGMGRGARVQYLRQKTHQLPTGHFWSEIFNGRHISVDYHNGEQILAVEGFRPDGYLWKFVKWEKIDEQFPLPQIFHELVERHEYINVEYIGGKVIELHFRQNPDFQYGNSVAYPEIGRAHV